MRSDNLVLQLPCVQPPTSAKTSKLLLHNLQLPHGRHGHKGHGSHCGHGGHGGYGGHGGHGGHGGLKTHFVCLSTHFGNLEVGNKVDTAIMRKMFIQI